MDGGELDVRLCRSGGAVATHDAWLARITGKSLPAYNYSDLKKRNALLIPWKVNDDRDILRMLELGADGVISDFPSRLKKVYNGRVNRDQQ